MSLMKTQFVNINISKSLLRYYSSCKLLYHHKILIAGKYPGSLATLTEWTTDYSVVQMYQSGWCWESKM